MSWPSKQKDWISGSSDAHRGNGGGRGRGGQRDHNYSRRNGQDRDSEVVSNTVEIKDKVVRLREDGTNHKSWSDEIKRAGQGISRQVHQELLTGEQIDMSNFFFFFVLVTLSYLPQWEQSHRLSLGTRGITFECTGIDI